MIADLIIICIMSLCIFLGYKRGLIKVAVRCISFVLALIIALVLYAPISNHIIQNTEAVPKLKQTITSKLYHEEEKKTASEEMKSSETVENYINQYTDNMKESGSEMVAEQAAIAVIRIGTWIGLFAISKLLLLIIRLFTDAIANIPIIKQCNKAGGIVYGILEGFVIIYAVLAIYSMVEPMIGENQIKEEIQNSHLCHMMYDNNLLLKIIL